MSTAGRSWADFSGTNYDSTMPKYIVCDWWISHRNTSIMIAASRVFCDHRAVDCETANNVILTGILNLGSGCINFSSRGLNVRIAALNYKIKGNNKYHHLYHTLIYSQITIDSLYLSWAFLVNMKDNRCQYILYNNLFLLTHTPCFDNLPRLSHTS